MRDFREQEGDKRNIMKTCTTHRCVGKAA